MHSVKNLLKKLTNKKNIFLVDRGDTAIKLSLQAINKEKILIQDQGGWLSYQKLPNIIYLKTNYGILDLNDLEVLILVILEKLPKPKIKNLSRLAYHACFSKFSGLRNFRTKAADYLGVQRSGLYHYVNEFKASGNFLEKIEKNAP